MERYLAPWAAINKLKEYHGDIRNYSIFLQMEKQIAAIARIEKKNFCGNKLPESPFFTPKKKGGGCYFTTAYTTSITQKKGAPR